MDSVWKWSLLEIEEIKHRPHAGSERCIWSWYISCRIRNGLHQQVFVLMKGNWAKRLRYVKWHNNWTENQWQQVLWRDESSLEPGPQHYWSSGASSWQTMEPKVANTKEERQNVPQEAWRTIPEDYLKIWQESLSKSVQTVLKNKGAQTKYLLSSLLELYELCFCLIYCISIDVCTCFNESVHLCLWESIKKWGVAQQLIN